ncbi:TetR/AcrR family transcriptional regulator [Streptomyces sp. NPDC093984]|uniref:TetR/AcrR family transcriptional regulator n=1 Tax=Streptomyces sp. NPDC093984 TaxID=3366052 RepID=UPI003803B204
MTRELTAKGKATQRRIIQGASEVLRERGVALATLDDVMARTQTSKSQLCHYFPGGKDELLLAVAKFEADRVLAEQQPYLGSLDSWEAWQCWRDHLVERYEEQAAGCPLGALFLHMGRTTPGARAVVVELMRAWQEDLACGIRALQRAGHLPADLDVEARSAALLAAIQGGVAILQATGQAYHLRMALDEGIAGLRRAALDHAAGSAGSRLAAL